MRRATQRTGAATLIAAVLLAGCSTGGALQGGGATTQPPGPTSTMKNSEIGIAAKSPQEIIEPSEAAFRSARAVRIKASITENGKPTRMDIKITSRNEAAGWYEENGTRLNFIITGGKFYLSGREFLRQNTDAATAELLGDRWVSMPLSQSQDLAALKAITITGFADEVFKEFTTEFTPLFPLLCKSSASVGGLPAVRLAALNGSDSYDVAAAGKPYPLLIEAKGVGRVEFSQYDKDPAIRAPRDALELGNPQG